MHTRKMKPAVEENPSVAAAGKALTVTVAVAVNG
jgi:hypothetical protein